VYVVDNIAQVVYKVSGGAVSLFAGTGKAGYSGDGGAATGAELNNPSSVAVDQTGAVYIADVGNYRIRKVVNGLISTVAGTGTPGFSGDGGPATAAQIGNFPLLTVAVDPNGNLYINEFVHIRKVTSNGIINTIAGSGTSGDTGDGGPAVNAAILASGVAADSSGNVYFADATDNVIRRISNAGIISTIAGDETRGYSGDGGPAIYAQVDGPEGVAVDTSGNIYVADTLNGRIRRISAGGIITTVAGDVFGGFSGDGGLAVNAALSYPNGVAASADGKLLIADSGNNRIREISPAGVIATIAGNGFENEAGDNGPAVNAQFLGPSAVSTTSSGSVLLGDVDDSLRQVSSAGIVTRVAGTGVLGYSGDGGPAVDAEIGEIGGIAQDAIGNVYLADSNSVVRKVAPDGTITTFAGNGYHGYSGDGQLATTASLNGPAGLVVDSSGNLYIEDNNNEVIRKVDNTTLTITTVVGKPFGGFGGDGGPANEALLQDPQGLAIDVQGNLYIADSGNSRIREVSAVTGIITTVAGNGIPGFAGDGGPATSAELEYPVGVAVDGSGNLYIADTGNNVVRKVSSSGIITTIAGTGGFGYSGDNGPALDATFYYVSGIAVGASGAVFVLDYYNNAARELTVCPVSVATSIAADSAAQTLTSTLTAAGSCQWAASNLPSWITSASAGAGSGVLSLTLQANTTGADRSATITVNGLSVAVSQRFTAELFQDVAPLEYYFDAVNLFKATMITSGCSVTEYCPTLNVTRAQMAVFIVRAVIGGDDFSYSQTPHFTDVQPTDFGFAWIQKMYELGITTGCGPALYCPNDSVTRAQMAVFIIRARYGSQTAFDYTPAPYFTDVPPTGFAYNYIQRMREDNITSGCGVSDYCPNNVVTRGDMAIFVMRGSFNQLLPPTEPIVASVTPATLINGTQATLTITGLGTHFAAGTTIVNAVPGLVVSGINVVNSTTLTATVTANVVSTPQPLSIWITDPTEEAVLPNGLKVQ
jgi:sugar lactone lactonase YvrE